MPAGLLAGVVHLGGGQAEASELDQLLKSMGQGGQGSSRTSINGAWFGRAGTEQIFPAVYADHLGLITAAARLDNRDELADRLQVEPHELSDLSDSGLLVKAFERWGEACPERLNGDWSLAVWSPATRHLFLARDHFGNTALYYARHGERVAFASDLKALLSLRWLPRRLNETRIASLLVGGGADSPLATVYEDISRLPPAHSATIAPDGERVVRYWRVEDTPDSGPTSPAGRVEALRGTLRDAVSSRVSPDVRVGSMLSGGLDSGAVTAFAAECLQRRGRRLKAFTSVPAFAKSHAAVIDEGPAAADVVRCFGNIDHVLIPARGVSPLAGVRRGLAILGEPSVASANLGWVTELMADARASGIDVLLTGQAGDFVMGGRPQAQSWQRDWSTRSYRAMLRRLAPNWMLRLRQVAWKPWRLGESPWRTFSVINDEFAQEIRLVERLGEAGRDPRRLKSRLGGRAWVAHQAMSEIGAIWAPLAAAHGLIVLDPLQDKRVMELMFSAPRPAQAGTTDRWLFRQSLVGLLPEEVVSSRKKSVQSADLVERLLASWAELEEAFAVAEASPLARRCIDLRYCRLLAESLRSPAREPHAVGRAVMLVNGMSAALFLAETWEGAA